MGSGVFRGIKTIQLFTSKICYGLDMLRKQELEPMKVGNFNKDKV